MNWRDRIRSTLVLGLTTAIVVVIATLVDLERVVGTLSSAHFTYILASFVVMAGMLVLKAYRWQVLLRMLGYSIPLQRCLTVDLATYPLVSITPSRSGELSKVYYFRDRLPARETVVTIVYERTLDVIILGLFGVVGVVRFLDAQFDGGVIEAGASLVVLAGIALGLALLTNRGRGLLAWGREQLDSLPNSLASARHNPAMFGAVVVYSLVLFGLSVLQTLLFFYALDINPPLVHALTRIPVAIFVGLLPVTVSGVGTRDAAFIALFDPFAPAEQLLAVGILFTTIRYWGLSIAGLPFLYREGRPS